MSTMATVTSKRQLTIPAKLFKRLNWKQGEQVIINEKNGTLTITSALDLIDRLAGSVKVPARFKGLSAEEIIEKAKKEYFTDKRNH